MPFSVPDFNPPPTPEPITLVATPGNGDVLWNRPIFKAPPLEECMRALDAKLIAQELRAVGSVQR